MNSLAGVLREAVTSQNHELGFASLFHVGRRELRVPHGERSLPLEMRSVAISIFYAVGTGVGGVVGPALYGESFDTDSRDALFPGYAIAAALVVLAALIACVIGQRILAIGA